MTGLLQQMQPLLAFIMDGLRLEHESNLPSVDAVGDTARLPKVMTITAVPQRDTSAKAVFETTSCWATVPYKVVGEGSPGSVCRTID